METVFTIKEAADRLGVAVPTIRSWIKKGFFPQAFKFNPRLRNSPYQIPLSDIRAFEAMRIASQPGNANTSEDT